jgi:TRAP-type C4-dicarboxylate transport system substrate-binding protein
MQEAERVSRIFHWDACKENDQKVREKWTESGCRFVTRLEKELDRIGSAVSPVFEHIYGRERLRLLQNM